MRSIGVYGVDNSREQFLKEPKQERSIDQSKSKGNKAASTRLRNALQQSIALAQEVRNEVTAKKNSTK